MAALSPHGEILLRSPQQLPASEAAWALASLRAALSLSSPEPSPLPERAAPGASDSSGEEESPRETLRARPQPLWQGFYLSADASSSEEEEEEWREAVGLDAVAAAAEAEAAEEAEEAACAIQLARAAERQCQALLRLRVREDAAWRQRQLESELQEAEAEEAEAAAAAEAEAEAAAARLAAADAAAERADAEATRARLAAVAARDAERRARVGGLLAREAAAARDEAAREAAARAEAAAAAAKAAAEAAAARAAAEEAARAEAAAAASRDSARAAASAASAAAASAAAAAAAAAPPAPAAPRAALPTGTPSALAARRGGAALLSRLRSAAAPFAADAAAKPARRALERAIALAVQQISGTRAQTQRKAAQLRELLSGAPGEAGLAHARLVLADRLLGQVQAQCVRLPQFAFALAETVALLAGGGAAEGVLEVVEAALGEACPLATPVLFRYSAAAFPGGEADYFRAMGYAPADGPGPGPGAWESTEAYLGRLGAFVRFYAALLQHDSLGGPAGPGLQRAWAYLARLLNGVPPGREAATALEAFLEAAGGALAAAYGRQYRKLLELVGAEVLPALQAGGDAEARPVAVRLRGGLAGGEYTRHAAGRNLPSADLSNTPESFY